MAFGLSTLFFCLLIRQGAAYSLISPHPIHGSVSTLAGLGCRSQSPMLRERAAGILAVDLEKPLGIVLEDREDKPGVYVAEILERGSAGRSELQTGDVLLKIDEVDVSALEVDAIVDIVADAGSPVTLQVFRDTVEEDDEGDDDDDEPTGFSSPLPPSPPVDEGGSGGDFLAQLPNPFASFQRPSRPSTPDPSEQLTGEALQARIDYLRNRERELEEMIQQEEEDAANASRGEEQDSEDDNGFEDEDDENYDDEEEGEEEEDAEEKDVGTPQFMIRLPQGVQPGQRCAATLPTGQRVAFTAPSNAEPGMLVTISAPSGSTDTVGPAESDCILC